MKREFLNGRIVVYNADCLDALRNMEAESVDCVITSPPYWGLRDYGMDGQLGLEKTFQEYIKKLCDIFDEVKRVLKKEGTCWVNLGDTYNANWRGGDDGSATVKQRSNKGTVRFMRGKSGAADKCLLQIPSRFAIEMADRGWILRNEIIWHKPNVMPQSMTDRFTVDFEKVFLFVKNKKYYFEQQLEPTKTKDNTLRDRETTRLNNVPGRTKMKGLIHNNYEFKNKRTVWTIPNKPFTEAHFATFPEALVEPMIKAGCREGGVVLDIFAGAGTTLIASEKLNRRSTGIELNPDYCEIIERRIKTEFKQKNLFSSELTNELSN